MIDILTLETEVQKTTALLELCSDRLVREIEERGGKSADTIAAGIVALAIDQNEQLIRVVYSTLDQIQALHNVRN